MKLIYIIGPYRAKTEWELEQNIRNAEKAALKLWQEGWSVICPHKNTAHFGGACEDKVWLDGDLEILKRCDAVFLLDNWSRSEFSKIEVAAAIGNNLRIHYDEGAELI